MSLVRAAVLGVVQGLSEFLPISSSGHLILVPALFRWPDQGLSFDVGLQGYDETKGRAFQRQALERIKALPGIESAALTDNIPLSLNYNDTSIYLQGQQPASSSEV